MEVWFYTFCLLIFDSGSNLIKLRNSLLLNEPGKLCIFAKLLSKIWTTSCTFICDIKDFIAFYLSFLLSLHCFVSHVRNIRFWLTILMNTTEIPDNCRVLLSLFFVLKVSGFLCHFLAINNCDRLHEVGWSPCTDIRSIFEHDGQSPAVNSMALQFFQVLLAYHLCENDIDKIAWRFIHHRVRVFTFNVKKTTKRVHSANFIKDRLKFFR